MSQRAQHRELHVGRAAVSVKGQADLGTFSQPDAELLQRGEASKSKGKCGQWQDGGAGTLGEGTGA